MPPKNPPIEERESTTHSSIAIFAKVLPPKPKSSQPPQPLFVNDIQCTSTKPRSSINLSVVVEPGNPEIQLYSVCVTGIGKFSVRIPDNWVIGDASGLERECAKLKLRNAELKRNARDVTNGEVANAQTQTEDVSQPIQFQYVSYHHYGDAWDNPTNDIQPTELEIQYESLMINKFILEKKLEEMQKEPVAIDMRFFTRGTQTESEGPIQHQEMHY